MRSHLPHEFIVERGDVVILAGTPHPSTVRTLGRAVGRDGFLEVLEAGRENYERIEAARSKSLALAARVRIRHNAVYSHRAPVTLHVSDDFPGDSLVQLDGIAVDNADRPGQRFSRVERVGAMALDDLLDELPAPPTVIILTCNGAELAAVTGAHRMLHATPPGSRAFVKTHALTASGESVFGTVCAVLQDAGFVVVRTRPSRSVSSAAGWRVRRGDVFAFKPG